MKTRTKLFIALLITGYCSLFAFNCSAQTYKLDKAGNITKIDTVKKKKVKQPDKVYKIVDGVTFYKGAKGGIYYWKTSKKTGKLYKCYVKD
jgi:hypothetical protein